MNLGSRVVGTFLCLGEVVISRPSLEMMDFSCLMFYNVHSDLTPMTSPSKPLRGWMDTPLPRFLYVNLRVVLLGNPFGQRWLVVMVGPPVKRDLSCTSRVFSYS